RIPPMLVILPLGILLSLMSIPLAGLAVNIGLPSFNASIAASDIWTGLITLAIAQIPLTIGNSVIATDSLAHSLFPEKKTVTVRRLGLTLGAMNIFSAFAGGIPMCHGAGGMAGHYRFGARRETALFFIGGLLLVLGIFFGNTLTTIFSLIPPPVLGVILFFASLELAMALKDVDVVRDLFIVFLVAVTCAFVQYGYLIGWIGGVAVAHAIKKNWIRIST
ncbi:MAG: putative sulfate/molybdate transporter, partial [Candidatus Bathyarchaeia archaeon]